MAIYGDPTTTPAIGIQLAKVINASSDFHTLINVNVWGHFSFTALYVCGSESCGFYDSSFRNNATGTNKFCAVLDGLNHWNTHSTFVTVSNPVGTVESFQQAMFISAAFQGYGSNGVIWMAAVQRHAFKRCYASNQSSGSNIFTIYQPASGGPTADFLELDFHIETGAVTNMVVVTAAACQPGTVIYNLTIADDACLATGHVFAIDSASALAQVELRDATINVWAASATLVDTPSKWVIRAKDATLYAPSAFNPPSVWTGPLTFATAPSAGFNTLRNWASTSRPAAHIAPSGLRPTLAVFSATTARHGTTI